jgi:hypothetical protein
MTEAERRIERQAIDQEEYAQRIHAQIVEKALARAARLVEREADAIMTLAETRDGHVRRMFFDLAKRIRHLS